MVSFWGLVACSSPAYVALLRICVYLLHRVYSLFLYRLSRRRVYRVG